MKLLLSLLCLTACSAPEVGSPKADPGPPPAGATVSASGHWTIIDVPPSPARPSPPPATSERTYYAELAGVSNEEAGRRLKEQAALRPEFERLLRRLRTAERGNFLDAELIHRPNWHYLLYFRREPAATLARYTSNPRFQARQGGAYTSDQLAALSQPWFDLFATERLAGGGGMDARVGRVDMDMNVTEAEYREIAARRGFPPVPAWLNLKFARPLALPAATADALGGVRLFPQSDRFTGAVNQAGFSGRLVLRDGCFFVEQAEGMKPMLAFLPREVGLYRDVQGYLALRWRGAEGRHIGRIGEEYMWSGPAPVTPTPATDELRARCGEHETMFMPQLEAMSLMHALYPHLRNPVTPPPPPPAPRR